jgi:hypothetical protein
VALLSRFKSATATRPKAPPRKSANSAASYWEKKFLDVLEKATK